VLAAETEDALVESLAGRPYWNTFARDHYAGRFEALAERFQARMERLDTDAQNSVINEWNYELGCQALKSEFEEAELTLLRRLATEAYERLEE
jgi:hypothetical protein